MAVTVLGGTVCGVDAIPIEVEVDILNRLPRISIVGLAGGSVKESAERVRSAVTSSGLEFPKKRVVVNLAPADVPKEGTAFDLPLALGVLAADNQLDPATLARVLAVGELSLGGRLRPVRGALSLALLARELGREIILPTASAAQAALVPGVAVRSADSLLDVVGFLKGEHDLPAVPLNERRERPAGVDMSEVRGQRAARWALEIAAAGAHHLMLVGPPGCGKSMLARRLPTILPPLRFHEALACTRIHSIAGLLGSDAALISARPFRAPHHSVTVAGLIGDASLRPGEVSLAHNGVLFLDEAPEFNRSALEVLREPLEDGRVRVTRARGSVEYPAAVTLVMAANPCPCGSYGTRDCICRPSDIDRYRRRLSGPILDRVDLHVELTPVPATDLLQAPPGEGSVAIRRRVSAARKRSLDRGQDVPNGQLGNGELEAHGRVTSAARRTLASAVEWNRLSGRAAMRVLRVARTVADLDECTDVTADHVHQALSFRPQAA